MLRDIKTRFGSTYFGFLFGLLLPLGHIGVILAIYVLTGRRAPIGTDVTLYLATAIVPFVIWSYTHQKVMGSVGQNRALTAFPIVSYVDILIARALVELLNAAIILAVVASAFLIAGTDLFIADPPAFFYALLLAYMTGVATGSVFAMLSILSPAAAIVGFIIVPLYWVSSGVFFIPEALPEQLRSALWVFPLSHIVDYARTAFFPVYLSDYPNLLYVNALIALNLLLALTMERFLRPILTSK